MFEGLTALEIADSGDDLRRRGSGWPKVPPVHPEPPWATLSGFADKAHFAAMLARSWPLFPLTGDLVMLPKVFDLPSSVLFMSNLVRAIPSDELSFH